MDKMPNNDLRYRNNLRNIQSLATSSEETEIQTQSPPDQNSDTEPSLWKLHGQRIQHDIERLLRAGKIDDLCVAIDNYVHNREERLPIPEVQPLSTRVSIPLTTVRPTTQQEMDNRRIFAQRSCKVKSVYTQLKRELWADQDQLFRKLRDLQRFITSGNQLNDSLEKQFLLPVMGQQLRTIFFLEKYKMMSCLPLKTGTTNWQRALVSLLYVDKDNNPQVDPNDVIKDNIYKEIPRYSYRYNRFIFQRNGVDAGKLPCIRRSLRKRVDDPTYAKWMNVRHPMSRLLSAWNQKFKNDYDGLDMYMMYVRKIAQYEQKDFNETENGHKVSLGAFLAYLGDVASDDKFNEHWKSYWYACSPCSMNYDYITKQETSAEDASFILQKNKISNLTYLPGQYNDSLVKETRAEDYFVDIDKSTIKTIYNIFFMDFVMFNYTIDEYL